MKIQNNLILIVIFFLINSVSICSQELFDKKKLDSVLGTNYQLKKASMSSAADNFGAFVHKDTTYFSSNNKTRRTRKKRNSRKDINKKNAFFFDIYFSSSNAGKKKDKIISLKGPVNTKLNESFPVISKNGKTMYYTGNFIHKGVSRKNSNILRATKENGVWKNVEYLPLNDKKYQTAQAVLNANETLLYFVSDRDSDTGDSDIFAAALHKDGSFGVPKKLGENVNTLKKEISPYITKNNELYFSSKGHGGFGGLDVFFIDLNDKNAKAINLGRAVNSAAEDFAFSMNPKTGKGFISSNRDGNVNIYEATQKQDISELIKNAKEEYLKKIQEEMYQATIINHKINSPIKTGFQPEIVALNKGGIERSLLQQLIDYLRKNPETILDAKSLRQIKGVSGTLSDKKIKDLLYQINNFANIKENKIAIKCKQKKKSIVHIAFYFDHNSSYFNTVAKKILKDFSKQLKVDRLLKIKFMTHADSRGSSLYNMIISKRRLERIKNYLYGRGVHYNQVVGEVYGEDKIINKCRNGNPCEELEHKKNRRVEYEFFRDL